MLKRFVALLGLLALAGIADAQTAQRNVTLSWALPTTATDGSPLTGNQAIQKVQVFLAATNVKPATPLAELTATSTTTNQTFSAAAGSTIFGWVTVCNSAGCSAPGGPVSVNVPVSVPNIPTSITITLN